MASYSINPCVFCDTLATVFAALSANEFFAEGSPACVFNATERELLKLALMFSATPAGGSPHVRLVALFMMNILRSAVVVRVGHSISCAS